MTPDTSSHKNCSICCKVLPLGSSPVYLLYRGIFFLDKDSELTFSHKKVVAYLCRDCGESFLEKSHIR